MCSYVIDDNIPIELPEAKKPRGREAKYPFRDLEIGQSFFVPALDATRKQMSAAATQAKGRLGCKFTCRARTEDGVEGTRIWRVE